MRLPRQATRHRPYEESTPAPARTHSGATRWARRLAVTVAAVVLAVAGTGYALHHGLIYASSLPTKDQKNGSI
ncbi:MULTISPECIES: hypothetical protein [Streptomyces]|jgi:hypothetical protein|uniref:hypothetical protein n=1 Tax=Streptomyces TaxID=1883 RepID=UPI001902FE81|nr:MULTISPECIES: hypothetical protein [unclassified Streptomyces]MCU4748681.1 hypothetical protein [Streptomyces sp. G-5]QQN79183.1 hypothetical protein IPZ77_18385 [Streptomyces sp. XC 2026]